VLAGMSVAPQPAARPAGPRAQLAPDLVFDVGFHRGEDTLYYLRKGFRVVAFEAHPELVDAAQQRFAAEIADGRLRVVPGAITAQPQETLTFYTHSRMSSWGTTESHRADRNAVMGESVAVTVPAVDFAACLREHGVPHYLKIDIEAADMLCLEALFDVEPEQRPRYASIEAESEAWSGVVRQFDTLERLGYSRFAIVQQGNIGGRVGRITTRDGRTIPYRFEMDSSGAFGEDLAGPWVGKREALRRYRRILPALVAAHAFDQLPKGTEIRYVAGALVGRPLPGWFDIHAAT
jgi:FkbM family methyltransferase